MASLAAQPAPPKASTRANPSRKVRIVAKIMGFTDQEYESLNGGSMPSISVDKVKGSDSSDRVTISFPDQPASRKNAYEVDYCYGQDEDNGLVFSQEIKPMIAEVFHGHNASIIAFGARGSGKTYTIQGSEGKPGLAMMAIDEILSRGEEVGKLVAISLCEVFQDHVYDLLHPEQLEVKVLEDAQGKINLKGLSQVPVKSLTEFRRIYFGGCSLHKPSNKTALNLPQRSHKGLIIHVFSHEENSSTKLAGKMNFIDLAGYEDSRRKSSDTTSLIESTKINKSLYALLNVIYAVNANEHHVPFRENTLTRMFRESFGGTNHVLMLNCLHPSFCKDTVCTLRLASRSCQSTSRLLTPSTKKSKSSSKPVVLSSLQNGRCATLLTTVRRQMGFRVHFAEKKASSVLKGRKLFDEEYLVSSKQAKSPVDDASSRHSKLMQDIASVDVPSLSEEEKSISDASLVIVPKGEESLWQSAFEHSEYTMAKEESLPSTAHNAFESSVTEKDVSPHSKSNRLEVLPCISSDFKALTAFEDGNGAEKENRNLLTNGRSPPLSARLKEITNNLRSLSSTPLCIKMLEEGNTACVGQVVYNDIMEPKTPVVDSDVGFNDKWEIANLNSPWETLNQRSSGMKHSFVQGYLNFLNTASKEELKGLRGIGEKRATYILELREESPEPFKNLEDLQDIGLSAKQIKGMMKRVAGDLLS